MTGLETVWVSRSPPARTRKRSSPQQPRPTVLVEWGELSWCKPGRRRKCCPGRPNPTARPLFLILFSGCLLCVVCHFVRAISVAINLNLLVCSLCLSTEKHSQLQPLTTHTHTHTHQTVLSTAAQSSKLSGEWTEFLTRRCRKKYSLFVPLVTHFTIYIAHCSFALQIQILSFVCLTVSQTHTHSQNSLNDKKAKPELRKDCYQGCLLSLSPNFNAFSVSLSCQTFFPIFRLENVHKVLLLLGHPVTSAAEIEITSAAPINHTAI